MSKLENKDINTGVQKQILDIHNGSSLIAICLKIESALNGKQDFLSITILDAIRKNRTPILEIIGCIQEFYERTPFYVIDKLGEDLVKSIMSISDLTRAEFEHMERTGVILPGSKFIHWSKSKKH